MDSTVPSTLLPGMGRLEERKCGMVNKKEPVPRMIKPVAMYLINENDNMDIQKLFYLLTLFNEYKKDIPIHLF